jgi:hypothetical protein
MISRTCGIIYMIGDWETYSCSNLRSDFSRERRSIMDISV